MGISTLVVSDIDRFVGMRDFWDRQLMDRVDNPFSSGSLMIEHWKLGLRLGDHPFLIIFLLDDEIVGFAPLTMRSKFGFRQVSSLHTFIYPEFFHDDIREACLEEMVDYLFGRLNCKSVELTFKENSLNQNVLEKVCNKKGFTYSSFPEEGEAIISINNSFESFQKSLGCKVRKKFRKARKKVVGSWEIYDSKFDSNSIKKIWEVEKHSWKNDLSGRDKAMKNWGLVIILEAVKQNGEGEPFFDSEVWFLDLDKITISYQLVLKRNGKAFFLKTSYDSRFKKIYPGKFLINELIERIFREQTVSEINFITNLPFVNDWKPSVRSRTKVKIERNTIKSKIQHLLFENRASYKIVNFFEDLKWKKLHP
jgi:hypothetical protein